MLSSIGSNSRSLVSAKITQKFTIETVEVVERKSVWQIEYKNVPTSAQFAIRQALDIWSINFLSELPVMVEVNWNQDLKNDVLASARPAGYFNNFPGAPDLDLWYPSALANSIAKKDLDPKRSDVLLEINAGQDWYFGLNGNPSSSEFDLVSVVLHEIAHGLAFKTNTEFEKHSKTGYVSRPSVFDGFIQVPDGRTFSDFCPRSSVLGNAMLGPLLWTGKHGTIANEGKPIQLYSTVPYEPGTSINHLDLQSLASPFENGLLTQEVSRGQVFRKIGPVILGMIEDMRNRRPIVQSISRPGKPLNVKAISGDKYAILTFDPGKCERSINQSTFIVTKQPGGQVIEYKEAPIIISGLMNGKRYKFRVQIKDSQGISVSEESNTVKPEPTSSFQIIDRESYVDNLAVANFENNPIVLYSDKKSSTLKMATWLNQKWNISTVRKDVAIGSISVCETGSKEDRALHVFYGEKKSGYLVHSRFQTKRWTHDVIDGNGDNSKISFGKTRQKTNSDVSGSNSCAVTSDRLLVVYKDEKNGLLLSAMKFNSKWIYEVIDGDRNADGHTIGDMGRNISVSAINGMTFVVYDYVSALGSSLNLIESEIRVATRKSNFPEDWKFLTLGGPEQGRAVSGYAVASRSGFGDLTFAWLASTGESLPRIDKLVLWNTSPDSEPIAISASQNGDISGPLVLTKNSVLYGCFERLCEFIPKTGKSRLLSGKIGFGKSAVFALGNKELVITTLNGKLGTIRL